MDKGASPLVPSCTVHALFQPVQHLVFPFLAILGQSPGSLAVRKGGRRLRYPFYRPFQSYDGI